MNFPIQTLGRVVAALVDHCPNCHTRQGRLGEYVQTLDKSQAEEFVVRSEYICKNCGQIIFHRGFSLVALDKALSPEEKEETHKCRCKPF